jgi:Iap family predicted aminopeptidase
MKELVTELCGKACAGRRPGTPGGLRARGLVRDALRDAGWDPEEQRIGVTGGANLVATKKGDVDRWVLVAAHYDHLGEGYPGADDNAAAVAILVETARALAKKRADGRGVIVAAFDAEEPPYYLTDSMGSSWWTKHPAVPLEKIDLMICMDLVGHALGPEGLPADVRGSVFALGAERSVGTSTLVDGIARAENGLVVRRADAEIIPPLSDYDSFWKRGVPFVFLTCGRSARYHTPQDTPDHLDWDKMHATSRWLERLVRASCARPEDRVQSTPKLRDDRSTLESFVDLVTPLEHVSPLAASGVATARELLAQCDADGRLPSGLADAPSALVMALEQALA